MQPKYKVILIAISYVAVFAAGRYLTPTKIKIETKVVTVEKIVESKKTDTSKDEHKKVVTHEVDKPDGEKDITTTTTDEDKEDQKIADNRTDDKTKTEDKTKEITKDSGHLNISALGGLNTTNSSTEYGLSVTKDVIGPFSLGVWGLNSTNRETGPSVGASFGLSF